MASDSLHRLCPLCGAREAGLIRALRYALFDDLGLSGRSPLMACNACGFVFNDLPEGPDVLAAYYRGNEHYVASTTAGSGGSSQAEIERYDRLVGLLNEWLSPGRDVADVGCGKGGFLAHLSKAGHCPLYGVEASASCREFAGRVPQATVVAGVEDLPSEPDVVILSHVLEHVYDPVAFLRTVADASSRDAVFYIEVPNTSALFGVEVPWSWLYFEHINHFDLQHLWSLVCQAGLAPLTGGTWSFLPGAGKPDECLYLVCTRSTDGNAYPVRDRTLAAALMHLLPQRPLLEEQVESILAGNPDLALWGVSQYAMLILGMHPELQAQVTALFDASTAKRGRRIGGVEILSPDKLDRLAAAKLLLLPRSGYTGAMRETLAGARFKHLVV